MISGEILGPRERLEFEHLLQLLRLSFLLTPVLIVLAFGVSAVGYGVWIALAVAVSFTWVEILARHWPALLLRLQLWLRVVDCALVYLVLVNLHGFLHNSYYDAVYLLFVLSAAATHGARGAWALSGIAGFAVFASRLQLIASGAMPFELRHVTDSIFYTVFFLVTASVVAFLMNKSADVVVRRDQAWRQQIGERNADLERTAGQLAESIRLRDAMLTGVTHDLRAPVTVVKVQAQVLRRRADPSLWPGIERIEAAASRMAQWIDELLESATLRGPDELQLTLESVDLVNLAREAVDEQQQNLTRHHLRVQSQADEIVGTFDAPRIRRVLDNLIGNAIKFSPAGGCVSVELASEDGWVTIAVQDQGVGIPIEDLPHVFDPFRRGSNVIGRISGTGIGLATAQRFVERHGGSLSVESRPGAGSRFTIRLPLSPEIDSIPHSGGAESA
jgi:signal transduction histidine kinase